MLRALPLALLLSAPFASAQTPAETTGEDAAPAVPADPPVTTKPASTQATTTHGTATQPTGRGQGVVTIGLSPPGARLGDVITLEVRNLRAALAEVEGQCSSLLLYIDGLPISDNPPTRCDPDDGHVGFLLARNEENEASWNLILGEPTNTVKNVQVTLGTSTTRSFPRLNDNVPLALTVLPEIPLVAFALLAVGTLAGMVYWGRTTSLLREPAGASKLPPLRRAYSLSRTQQAFWFVLALLAYAFVWLMTWDLNTLTPSVLALIGISAGTALGAELIDGSKVQTLKQRLATLEEVHTTTEVQAGDPTNEAMSTPETRSAQRKLSSTRAEIAAVSNAIERTGTRGFLWDILSDANGISLQRAQIAGWTLVLGCIFVYQVYADLTMPDFSATLLALMGLSSGTYLAGKTAENPVVPAPTPPG